MYKVKFNQQQGFTLIEVLVAVVIMAIGLLGLAALQNASLRFSYDSYLRTQTTFFANDLFDRIRANPTVVYDLSITTTGTGGSSVDCSTASADCPPASMMQYDIRSWAAQVDNTFPGSTVTVTTNAAPVHTYTITFRWDSRTDDGNNVVGGADNRESFVYTARVAE